MLASGDTCFPVLISQALHVWQNSIGWPPRLESVVARFHCGMMQIGICRCVTRALVMCFGTKARLLCEVIDDSHHGG